MSVCHFLDRPGSGCVMFPDRSQVVPFGLHRKQNVWEVVSRSRGWKRWAPPRRRQMCWRIRPPGDGGLAFTGWHPKGRCGEPPGGKCPAQKEGRGRCWIPEAGGRDWMACPAVAPVAMEMSSKQEPLRRRAPSSPVTPVQPDALQRRARDHDTHP